MPTLRIRNFTDYKTFLRERLEAFPQGGRGQLQRLAQFLQIHPSLVSQILNGPKDFTSEQSCLIGDYLGLTEIEGDYFLALVERDRAGNPQLKKYWERKLKEMRDTLRDTRLRIPEGYQMTETQRIQFYSSWEFSAVRLASGLKDTHSIEAIAKRLGLSPQRVRKIVDFNLSAGLCIEKNNKIFPGPARLHLSSDSPLVKQNHLNWRIKGLQAIEGLRDHEMAFTAPLTLSRSDRGTVKEILREAIERISDLLKDSPDEELCCVVLDWFDVRPAQGSSD